MCVFLSFCFYLSKFRALFASVSSTTWRANYIKCMNYFCRALCQERYKDWNEKFGLLGLRVGQLTGDSFDVNFADLNACNIMYVVIFVFCSKNNVH